ncbi:unnamed protein product [Rhizoctonia solani]|uniref:Uncharacterized protein n=1 Tax=Rhizoctonia solani TaxID=456999 RepID=A0A8H2WJ24_9AGAM|nr:unnamed protein product [Rhizoctonia solani]
MRTLGTLGVVALVGLLSNGALGRPIPPRVIYPYPIYHSDGLLALDLRSGRPIPPRAHLELSLAAFSKAMEVGFVNAVIRPREHLVSLSRYYKLPERLPTFSIDAKQGLGWPTNNLKKRHESDGSEESARADTDPFPIHNRRRRGSDDPGVEAVRSPDYRRHTELERSSTHAVAGEHLKAKRSAPS